MSYTLSDTTSYLQNLSNKTGASMEADDPQKLLDKLTGGDAYDPAKGGDPNKAFQEFEDQYTRRGMSQRTGQGPDSGDILGTSTSTSNNPGTYANNNGFQASSQQLDSLISAIQGIASSDPDISASQVPMPNELPTIEVQGQDLSPSIDQTLQELMGGNNDPLNLQDKLSALLDRTAGGGINSERLQSRLEGARENLTAGETAALSDLRGVLADRGLISTPGSPEGAELESTQRAFLPLQREYLSNVRQSYQDESQLADEQELNALQQATGWSRDQAASRLAAVGTAQDRQKMFADIAARNLEDNMAWNQFLAQFGLDREKTAAAIKQGKIDAIMPAIQMFLALVNRSAGGYI